MPRAKVTPEPVLKSWNGVDEALKEIAENQTAIEALDAQMVEKLMLVKAGFEARILPLSQRLKRCEKDVKEFTEAHKAELEETEGKRSKVLNWGTVGFRRSKELATVARQTWKGVVEILRKAKATRFYRVSYAVDKEAVRAAIAKGNLPEKKLKTFGMRIVEKDTFGYELKRDEVEDRDAA